MNLALHACAAASGERFDLGKRCPGNVTRERRQQGSMRPADLESVFGRATAEQRVDQTGSESVAATDAIEELEEIEFEDEKGKWHTETARGSDRPETVVKDRG